YSVIAFDRGLPSGCTPLALDTDVPGVGVTCRFSGSQKLHLRFGDGDDFVAASELPHRISLDVDTGDGVNAVEGGSGNDSIVGGIDGDTLYGGPGADVIRAGDGFNFLHGNSGADSIVSGNDFDFVYGDASDDLIYPGSNFNFVFGGGGNDSAFGGPDTDTFSGGSGNDNLFGANGDDELNGGSGNDTFDGGQGDDLIRARDGATDEVGCGRGNDTARVDASEIDKARKSCENVVVADPAVVDPEDEFDVIDESFEEAVDAVDEGLANQGHAYGFHRWRWFHQHPRHSN
ncbi:MAG: hypothetical protein JWN41_34, partial [Thermoleophilia bacterium]|nr:hypothetical protein [Thermoleophilia bacterium]